MKSSEEINAFKLVQPVSLLTRQVFINYLRNCKGALRLLHMFL